MSARLGRGRRRRTRVSLLRGALLASLVVGVLTTVGTAAAAPVPIVPGGPPVTVDVSSPGGTATLTFDGTAGQRVSLDITDVTIGTSTCCSTKVSLVRPDGKVLVALTLGTNGGFIDTRTLPLDGTYSILVDAQSANIGNATLTLYDVPDDTTAAIVADGPSLTVATAVPGQNAQTSFDGAAGHRLSLNVSDVTVGTSVCCSTKVSILRPDGKTLATTTLGSNGGFIDTQTLPVAGTYAIVVDPQGNATGSAALTLYTVPPDATATIVAGGAPVSVTTSVPGQNARVSFSGVSGQRVSLDVGGVTVGTSLCCGIKVSIVRSNGTVIAGPTSFGTLGGFLDTVALPTTGTYSIVVDPQGPATGDVVLTLFDVPADIAGTIVPGGPTISVTTTVPGQNARLTFSGTTGQRVSLDVSGVSMGPSSCCSVKVSLLRSNGAVLAGPISVGTSGGFLDAVMLPTTSTYTILVDPQGGVTGDASLTLYDVPADATGSIVPGGAPATVSTTVPGQNGALTFPGTAGQRISLSVGPACCPTKISILKPNGSAVAPATTFSSFGGFVDTMTLPTTGTYTVLVDPQGGATGDVAVRIYTVPADVSGTIAFGSSTTVTTTVPGQNAAITFTATAGQRMSLEVRPTCCAARITVLKPNSSTLVGPITFGTVGGFLDTTVLSAAGTYTILVDPQAAATGSVTLSLFDVPDDVTGTIAFGSPTTVTTTVPGQDAALTFSGTAGQRVSLKVGPGCCTTNVSILRPDSTVLASVTSFGVFAGFIDATTLPATGTYTIVVDPAAGATGATPLTLYDVPPDVEDTIAFGESRTELLGVPGQNARVTFSGTAGQVVSLHLADVSIGTSVLSGTTVSILRPDAAVVASTNVGTNGGFIDAKTLPVTGTYTILVDPLGANTGSITLSLDDVPVDVTGAIVPGGAPVTVTTATSGQNARLSFSGTAGQRVSLQVGSSCCLAQVSILNPDGSSLAGPTTFGTGGGFVDTHTLPATGTYEVFVDPQGAATGSITLTLYDVPPDASDVITAGGPGVGVTTTVPGQNAALTFSGTAGQRVSLKVSPGCCVASYLVLDPSAEAVVAPVTFGTGGGFIDTVTLPATGTYTIGVNPQGAATGSVTINLYDVPLDVSGTATLGGPAVTVTTTTPGQNALISFNGAASDGVAVRVGPFNCCSTRVSVLNPDGSTLSGPVAFNPDGGTIVARLGAAGTYAVRVDPQGAGFGDLHIRLDIDNTAPAPPVLTLSESSPDGHVSGTTYFYRPAGSGGSFSVTATASDGGTGLQKMTFAGLAGGFTPTTLTEDKIVPYSQTYTWLPGATFAGASNLVTAYDNVGNASSAAFGVVQDPDPPTTTDNTAAIGSSWKNTDQFVTLSATDGSGSGSARSYYTTDGSTPTAASAQGTAITLSAEGVYTVKYFSVDNVGNVEAVRIAGTQVRIDKTAPTSATLGALPAVIKNGQVLTGSGSDALSGLGSMAYYYCLGTSCTPSTLIGTSSTGPGYSVTWSSQPADGTYQVLARAIDSAGNTLNSAKQTVAIDNTPPTTTIGTKPANPTNATSATFSFTASEAATFQCQLDGSIFTACTSPISYSSLAPGSHTFAVRGTDAIGNVGSAATYTWTIDTTPPDTTITASPPNPSNSTAPSFSFTSTEPGSTFQCQLDGAAFAACSSPKSYTGLAVGSHTFQVRATDPAGNADPTPASYTWTVDTGAPDTSITATPANPTNAGSATFSFTSTETGSTFECQLDGGGFSPCTNPKSYAAVTSGSHTFNVRATDPAGNTDPTPASFTWTVDTAAPDTSIASGPASPTNATTASFNFTSTEAGSAFECQLDGGGFSSCTSPKTYIGLGQGSHAFDVRATDPAGNTDPTPASFAWTVDTTAPETTITTQPNNPTNASSASFSFTSNETGTGFQCQLDGAGFLPCGSPQAYSGLGEGAHTFQVKATDPAGNVDSSPATFTWTVDATPPDTSIGSAPANPTNSPAATFTFTSSESGSTFSCRLDGAPFAACTSPATYSSLAEGSHTFQVAATDQAANTDPTPAARTWTIDRTPPAAPVIETPLEGTRNNTGSFTLSGTAEAGTTLEVFDGATSRGTTTVGAGGSWAKALIGVPDGSHSYTAYATDAAGNVSAASNARTIVVDTTAPNTLIGAGPIGATASTSAIFSFSADDPAATFECSTDGSAFSSCTSPKTYSGLAEGPHTFQVRATDQAGNTDPTPATRSWTVDVTPPPAPQITSPADGTLNNSGSFTLSGTAEAGTVVEVFEGAASKGAVTATGGGTWSKPLTGVADGSHTYTATATDSAGNTSPVSNARTVVVDSAPPETTIGSGPSGSTSQSDASFVFSSNESGGTFSCRIDGAAFAACTSPMSYSGLGEGSHMFEVKATDAAGNTDTTPATRTWTVDATAPDTAIDSGPTDPTSDTTATFTFSSTDGSATFECSLDGSSFSSCASPQPYSGLAAGAHTFAVRAVDAAGNVDATPATYAWNVA